MIKVKIRHAREEPRPTKRRSSTRTLVSGASAVRLDASPPRGRLTSRVKANTSTALALTITGASSTLYQFKASDSSILSSRIVARDESNQDEV
jgi:hypothetical protein